MAIERDFFKTSLGQTIISDKELFACPEDALTFRALFEDKHPAEIGLDLITNLMALNLEAALPYIALLQQIFKVTPEQLQAKRFFDQVVARANQAQSKQ